MGVILAIKGLGKAFVKNKKPKKESMSRFCR